MFDFATGHNNFKFHSFLKLKKITFCVNYQI